MAFFVGGWWLVVGQFMKIAYQGEPGAYSEAAALRFSPNATTVPCESFDEVFAAVEGGKTTHGILPIENSIGGSITAIRLRLA